MWTIPNIVSFARLLGIPALLYYGLYEQNDLIAFWIFALASITDWLDGFLARKLNQFSELGALLDPIADRLYIITAIAVLLLRGLIPLLAVALIIGREIWLFIIQLNNRKNGYQPPKVHYVGKAGTLLLLYSLPGIFLGNLDFSANQIFHFLGLAFLWWGIGVYWYAGFLYRRQINSLALN
jgi:cardiolipin synthase